jgi:pyruvate formate lyase activating enzyme
MASRDPPRAEAPARNRYELLDTAKAPLAGVARSQVDDRNGTLGYIHSFESAGTLDGPGIRCVIFTTGCPLRCQYCHNPDTWRRGHGTPMTLEQVLAEIDRYARFLGSWGGGVTVSGGEPLLQDRFLAQLLQACKQRKLHTAIDTSGYLGDRMTPSMLDDTDLVLLDIKAFDSDLHQRVTGAPVEPTLEFARRLAAAAKPVWIRFVLVPALTDDRQDIARLAEFVAALGNVERVEVLPFHKMGEAKWQTLGLEYRLTETPPPSPDLVRRVQDQFREHGLLVF